MDLASDLREENGDAWCTQQGIDYWNHPEQGWAATVTAKAGPGDLAVPGLDGLLAARQPGSTFNAKIRRRGAGAGADLQAHGPAARHAGGPARPVRSWAVVLTSFLGFTYSAALSVVEVDILTGEIKILSSDLVYDMGWS